MILYPEETDFTTNDLDGILAYRIWDSKNWDAYIGAVAREVVLPPLALAGFGTPETSFAASFQDYRNRNINVWKEILLEATSMFRPFAYDVESEPPKPIFAWPNSEHLEYWTCGDMEWWDWIKERYHASI